MTAAAEKLAGLGRFRTKLFLAMMVLVSVVAAAGLLFAQRNVANTVKLDFERAFHAEVAALDAGREVRHAVLAERCRALARRPRIHAALEDDALDLLYPSARDELADIMAHGPPAHEGAPAVLQATFYRFLDGHGRVIAPADEREVGELAPQAEARLALERLPDLPQTGYLARQGDEGGDAVDEVIAMPIISSETGQTIAAMVLGFRTSELSGVRDDSRIKSGIWLNGRLHLLTVSGSAKGALAERLQQAIGSDRAEGSFSAAVGDVPYLLFFKRLNPDSLFPPAYEVSLYPLADSLARQRQLLWQFGAAGILLWLVAFGASHVLAGRLSQPVERLAVTAETNRSERQRAEEALETTHQELQRSARFSADASHQLKTPVTVLRAGLEGLLAEPKLAAETREELSGLVHQTFRLTSVIDDLLLLSRMDAGRLRLDLAPLDLVPLIAGGLDDLGAVPDGANLVVEAELPGSFWIVGERGYTALIVQNLLENARKYNRVGGRIKLGTVIEGPWAVLTVGNTGRPIPVEAQTSIFDRFHRGAAAENLPGHGLGLNLARELARLHGGELLLLRSGDDWTEFEVRFRPAPAGTGT